MKGKPRLGLDLDDVLIQTFSSILQFHNRVYGTTHSIKQLVSYNLAELWGCPVESALKRVLEFYYSPEHDEAEPVPGAVEAVAYLRDRFDLYIITSRSEFLTQKTLSLIHPFFPLHSFKDIIFINQFYGTDKRSKADVCKDLRITTMIEDCIEHAYELSAEGVRVLLLASDWNHKKVSYPIVSVETWEKALVELLVPGRLCEDCFQETTIFKKVSMPDERKRFVCLSCAELIENSTAHM